VRALLDRLATDFPVVPPRRAELTALSEFAAVAADPARTDYRDHLAPFDDIPENAARRDPRGVDIHRALGSLMAYPDLLRRLGLIVDLRVALPPATPVETVSVAVDYDGAGKPLLDADDKEFWQLPAGHSGGGGPASRGVAAASGPASSPLPSSSQARRARPVARISARWTARGSDTRATIARPAPRIHASAGARSRAPPGRARSARA